MHSIATDCFFIPTPALPALMDRQFSGTFNPMEERRQVTKLRARLRLEPGIVYQDKTFVRSAVVAESKLYLKTIKLFLEMLLSGVHDKQPQKSRLNIMQSKKQLIALLTMDSVSIPLLEYSRLYLRNLEGNWSRNYLKSSFLMNSTMMSFSG